MEIDGRCIIILCYMMYEEKNVGVCELEMVYHTALFPPLYIVCSMNIICILSYSYLINPLSLYHAEI